MAKIVLIDLYHPTFAMTGALAWQVTKKKHNKKIDVFLVLRERSHGEFARGLSHSGVCSVSLPFLPAISFLIKFATPMTTTTG